MSLLDTLQDLPKKNMMYVRDHLDTVSEYQRLAFGLATKLTDAKKRADKDTHYIMLLENKIKELDTKYGGIKIVKVGIEQDNVFNRLNKLLIDGG
jgi:hypothetical protein